MSDKLSMLTAASISGLGAAGVSSITSARKWSNQIRAAYALLYPLIAKDFRHVKDCDVCHNLLSVMYVADDAKKHRPKTKANDAVAQMMITRSVGPFGAHSMHAMELISRGFLLFGADINSMGQRNA